MRQQHGFTLMEMVAVILLVSILSFAMISRMSNKGIELAAQVDQLAGDIRYTQSLAMTQGQRFRIDFNTGANTYQILTQAGGAVTHPVTGGSGAISLGNGITYSAVSNAVIVFDGLGRPYSNTATPGTLLGADAVITLVADGEMNSVRISPQTGRVVVQ
jgi:prepilin-type N-terminal cleavage/methylation domain-containing protein